MRGTSEQEWLIPAIGLTLLSGTFALAFLPDYSGILPSLELLPWWLIVAALAWAVCGPVGFFPMMLKGVRNPLQHLGDPSSRTGRRIFCWASESSSPA